MKQRFEVLDVFRGIFSYLVVYLHLGDINNFFLIETSFIRHSDLFVDFFFVLSGFVIAYNYQGAVNSIEDLRLFLKKRFLRLFPLHFFLIIVFLVYVLARNYGGFPLSSEMMAKAYSVETFFSGIFFLNSVKLPGIDTVSWNFPSWSISAEMISYVVFVFTILSFSSFKKYILIPIYIIIIITALLVIYNQSDNHNFILTYNNGFLRGITGFFFGTIAFNLYSRIKYTASYALTSGFEIVACIAVVVLISITGDYSIYGYLFDLLFMITIVIFANQGGVISKWILKKAFLKKLGKISYSVYLNHMLILIIIDIAFKRYSNRNQIIDGAIILLATVIVYYISIWTYNNIEQRFLRGFKKQNKVSAIQ